MSRATINIKARELRAPQGARLVVPTAPHWEDRGPSLPSLLAYAQLHQPHAGPFRGRGLSTRTGGLGLLRVLPDLSDLSLGQKVLPALRDTEESVGLNVLEVHLCALTARALRVTLLELFCLFQPKLALEVRGDSFSCAKALEGVGENEFTLRFGFESVGWWVPCPTAERAADPGRSWGTLPQSPQPSLLLVRALASPLGQGFSWLNVFLQGSLGAAGLPGKGDTQRSGPT